MALVQSLDPPGVAARSLEECIALQAKAADRYDPAMARLIANLDLLAKGGWRTFAASAGSTRRTSPTWSASCAPTIPSPAAASSARSRKRSRPTCWSAVGGGGWIVELNNAALPRVLVNRRYHAELKRGPQDKASKAWLGECLASANWLVKALDQRARTIVKVASEIVKQQQGFFEQGVSALKPLTLRQGRRGDRDA